ncbi:YybH family protein [Paraburkholderia gardini]|uniref:DUF4440 domain-containing protein n=1 Tax=Paraburkholderia gardini TaxID=2823469 RepID=A0ABM8U509_9BURK|nr:SgcJ/EcaC family oxidoreductase [Paraburkholderia gardini]CAG4902101.1 hypothetical protein R54767_02815 [Paraburkholderia gardini]
MSDDEQAIRTLIDTWMTASRSGDTATVLSLMTDDVVFMTPGHPPFGKETFAAMSTAMQNVRMEGTAEIEELQVAGDWAFVRNHLDITIRTPGGAAPVHHAGHTLTILRKDASGRWLLARDANLVAAKS